MNISLTPELEKFISSKVESGRYHSASEVVREALRLLEERDQVKSAQLAEFNQELGRRLDSLDRGERVDPVDARGGGVKVCCASAGVQPRPRTTHLWRALSS
jgi:antitoxin ParD1/3/4